MIVKMLYSDSELKEYREYCKICDDNGLVALSITEWLNDYQDSLTNYYDH